MRVDVVFSETSNEFNPSFGEINNEFVPDFGNTTIVHDGQNGATFTPYVSADGVISWTNDRELPNPEPVNIKGERGVPGDSGKDGYTPRKGIDYFDGKDGYTPQKRRGLF